MDIVTPKQCVGYKLTRLDYVGQNIHAFIVCAMWRVRIVMFFNGAH